MNQDLEVNDAQVGRILHYVDDSDSRPVCRPAIVTNDLQDISPLGVINLQVFADGNGSFWKRQVKPNHKARQPKTWHWPRECRVLSE